MKYIQYSIIIILSAVLLSCETSVDASDLLAKEQLVVINGYLSPQDTTLKVQVSKSRSRAASGSQNNENLIVNDALVVLSDEEGNEVTLTYSNITFSYEAAASELVITPGRQYFLTAVVEGKEYRASCTIPAEQAQNVRAEILDREDDELGNQSLKVTVDDIRDKRNFYIVGAAVNWRSTDIGSGEPQVSRVDFEFEQFTTDSNRENALITVDGFFFIDTFSETLSANIQVANAEQILYDALRATFLNDYNEDDPFFEPVIAPTNIQGENGFGVFAGYQLLEEEIIF
ncbi:DUF4249 domain-containing protein [Aquimarina sp. D1M17]|uniref:DUF4249 domain-containing protein n=1 Tax=Aquimarina acroporae TaxID=2937283 RepID=UPI0020BE7774|nr:DUF4249 domain-containing protein [Aquimarina acroporae]MCK8524272.1 DUF4249 domain-containing protein [Aquimarina acroporae]